ncbi:MAG: hypothetical protein ACPHRO_04650 [Nannocystaceae bacterium]
MGAIVLSLSTAASGAVVEPSDVAASEPATPTTEPEAPPAAVPSAAAEPPAEERPPVAEQPPESGAPTAENLAGVVAPDGEAAPTSADADLPQGYSMSPPEVGPPFYNAEDEAALRERFELKSRDADGPEISKGKRAFRCWVADPSCGWTLEVQATSAYARRFRQGNVNRDELYQWDSGRAQYDLWLNLPVVMEVVGQRKYTRLTLGPKGGVIASDEQSLWGNVGIAMRYWFKRGSWSPTLEVSSGISFWLRGERGTFGVEQQRSPLGLTGDVGVGVGGWGALIVGGQINTPLARDELPDEIRISTSGSVFVGFRGNIAWGLPAVASVATHGLTQRNVTAP